jgi:RNA polymerase sigma-70 factor (ECF subfamily)
MAEAPSFHEQFRRVRAGDQEAAAELVRQYEPLIRRAIRFRLAGARLGGAVESADVCQSVLGSFFVRAAAGQYDLGSPGDLVRLLTTMARNKLISQARRERAARRDRGRTTPADANDDHLIGSGPSPSQTVAAAELLQEVHRRLAPDERRLMELRREGLDWATIAQQVGDTPVLLRKRLSRALDRVTRDLGLEVPADE